MVNEACNSSKAGAINHKVFFHSEKEDAARGLLLPQIRNGSPDQLSSIFHEQLPFANDFCTGHSIRIAAEHAGVCGQFYVHQIYLLLPPNWCQGQRTSHQLSKSCLNSASASVSYTLAIFLPTRHAGVCLPRASRTCTMISSKS